MTRTRLVYEVGSMCPKDTHFLATEYDIVIYSRGRTGKSIYQRCRACAKEAVYRHRDKANKNEPFKGSARAATLLKNGQCYNGHILSGPEDIVRVERAVRSAWDCRACTAGVPSISVHTKRGIVTFVGCDHESVFSNPTPLAGELTYCLSCCDYRKVRGINDFYENPGNDQGAEPEEDGV